MSSFDDESTLFDPTSPKEKEKTKSRFSLSPKRNVKTDGKKSPKKEKKKFKGEDTGRFIQLDNKKGKDEKSDEWLKFEEMQKRIKANVEKTQVG